MENAQPTFDWIAWLASVPGIPAGWGEAPAELATVMTLPVRAEADLPELKAA